MLRDNYQPIPEPPACGFDLPGRTMNYIFCDLDGTLSDDRHRFPLLNAKNDYQEYHLQLGKDPVKMDVLERVHRMLSDSQPAKLVLVTMRPNIYRETTEEWLSRHQVHYNKLLMRPDNIVMSAPELKVRLVEFYLGKFIQQVAKNIVCVVDNEIDIIRAFRAEGARTLWIENVNCKRKKTEMEPEEPICLFCLHAGYDTCQNLSSDCPQLNRAENVR